MEFDGCGELIDIDEDMNDQHGELRKFVNDNVNFFIVINILTRLDHIWLKKIKKVTLILIFYSMLLRNQLTGRKEDL